MKLTISTGVRVATDYPDHGYAVKVWTVDIPNIEIDPDAVFVAGNRIEETEVDCANLKHDWQRKVREALDANESPSISVADTIELCTDQGLYLGGWRCEPSGWTTIPAEVSR